jgi:hypothetical protein
MRPIASNEQIARQIVKRLLVFRTASPFGLTRRHYAVSEIVGAINAASRMAQIAAFIVGKIPPAWPPIKMQEHKTARMPQEQQSLASGALLGQLKFSVSARVHLADIGQCTPLSG